ncbi:MAG: hypothetical protein ACRDPT_03070 [Streptomycetales bacterium]
MLAAVTLVVAALSVASAPAIAHNPPGTANDPKLRPSVPASPQQRLR